MMRASQEKLIDSLRDELYKRHSWTGDTAVRFMVPIILAIRHKDTGTDDASIIAAWTSLREGGKRELDDTLIQVKHSYHDISPLLRDTLDDMIRFVNGQPDGIIYDILNYLGACPGQGLLLALRNEDFIGTLFERAVSDAFRGDDGRFFTPRNIILIAREMMRLLLEKQQPGRPISSYTFCDPCAGSARFPIYWSELIKHEILADLASTPAESKRRELTGRMRAHAEHVLFGADIHQETAVYGCLNMLLHGDGASNITAHDSLDLFGFFADVPLLRRFALEFETKWPAYSALEGPARRGGDLASDLDLIEAKRAIIDRLISTDTIDLAEPAWLDVIRIVHALIRLDREYETGWETIRPIHLNFRHRAVIETLVDDWLPRNPDIGRGFDVLITNPPFGRQATLTVKDLHLLCQYRLATELWVPDMPRTRVEPLLSRTLAADTTLHAYYIDLVRVAHDKTMVDEEDGVEISRLPVATLLQVADRHGIVLRDAIPSAPSRLKTRLRREITERTRGEVAGLAGRDAEAKRRLTVIRRAATEVRRRLDVMSVEELEAALGAEGLDWSDAVPVATIGAAVGAALGRAWVTSDDEVGLVDLASQDAMRICSTYLYENSKPGKELSARIVAYFDREWLTVDDIEGPGGYASKATLVFNGQPHTIYYDAADTPIVYNRSLPKQVLFVEQFLRMVKEGGHIFTVLDTGVLSNIGDEYVRQFMYKNAYVRAIVEFPHGAFKAAEANVKTAIILLEKDTAAPREPYRIFGALPRYLGFSLNKQDVPEISENDLGKVTCDYSSWLGLGRPCQHGLCPWDSERHCTLWDAIEQTEETEGIAV